MTATAAPDFTQKNHSKHLVGPLLAIGAVTIWRVTCLAFNPIDLFVDESQYWLWGQELAFGYYSKPPLIGWVIRLFNEIGQSDAAFWVRLPAQIFHGLTGVLVALVARSSWKTPAAAWAGAVYVTLPGVSVLAFFVSTDDLVLTAFALALLALVRLQATPSLTWALVLGAAIGFGVLAKYAMVFAVGILLALQASPRHRIAGRDLAAAAIVAALTVLPHLLWNVQNGLITFSHTADNADWKGIAWNWSGLAEFIGTQIIAFGIILGPAYVIAVVYARRRGQEYGLLLWFSLPIFLAISLQAVIEGANGNWAAPAFVAGTVLAAGWLLQSAPRLFIISLALNTVIALALPLTTIWADRLVMGDKLIYERALRWSHLSGEAFAIARDRQVLDLIARERAILADLVYHSKGTEITVHAWPPAGQPRNHYAFTRPVADNVEIAIFVGEHIPATCPHEKLGAFTPPAQTKQKRPTFYFVVEKSCWENGS